MCEEVVPSLELESHVMDSHYGYVCCPLCRRVGLEGRFLDHMWNVHGIHRNRLCKCEVCDTWVLTKGMKRHMREKHPDVREYVPHVPDYSKYQVPDSNYCGGRASGK